MTTVTSVISATNNGHGRGLTVYTDPTHWEAAAPSTLTDIWRGECYNDNGGSPFTDAFSVGGSSNASSSLYKELTAAAGQSFVDTPSNALRYNAANGAAIEVGGAWTTVIDVSEAYFKLSRMQLFATSTAGSALYDNGGNLDINQCILKSGNNYTSPVVGIGTNSKIRNSLVHQICSGSSGYYAGLALSGNGSAYNTTIYTFTATGSRGISFYYSNGTVENCASFGFTIADKPGSSSGATITGSYSDVVGASGGWTGSVPFTTATFANVTGGSEDMKLVSGSGLTGVCTADTTNAPVDIFGVTRPTGANASCAGCFEYVVPPSAPARVVRKLKPWGMVKPPAGYRLDWGDPINAGLKIIIPSIYGGQQYINSVTGAPVTYGPAGRGAFVQGKFGGALKFGGTTAIVLSNKALGIASGYTLCAWITGTDSGYRQILSKDESGRDWQWRRNTSEIGFIRFDSGGSVVANFETTGANANSGRPVFVAATFSASTGSSIYVNGRKLASDSNLTQNGDNANYCYLGAREQAFSNGDGSTDIIEIPRLYNRCLSPTEIARLYTEPFAGIIPPRRRIVSGAAAGSSTFDVSITESGALSDAPTNTALFSSTLTESGALSSTQTNTALFAATLTESGAVSDAPTSILTQPATSTESGPLSDSQTNTSLAAATLTESGTLSDAPTNTNAAAATLTESGTLSDAPSVTGSGAAASITETGTLSDAPTNTALFAASLTESGTLSDAPTNTNLAAASGSESGALSSTQTATATGNSVDITESAALSESSSVLAAFAASSTETGTLSDAPTAAGALLASITESGALSDAQSALITLAAALTEAGTFSDQQTNVATAAVTIIEQLTLSESTAVQWLAHASVTEVATLLATMDGTLGFVFPSTVSNFLRYTIKKENKRITFARDRRKYTI